MKKRGPSIDPCGTPPVLNLDELIRFSHEYRRLPFQEVNTKPTQNDSSQAIIFTFLNNQIMVNDLKCSTEVKEKTKLFG